MQCRYLKLVVYHSKSHTNIMVSINIKPRNFFFALLGTLITFTCLDFRASVSHDRFYTADCLLIEYSNSASNSTF